MVRIHVGQPIDAPGGEGGRGVVKAAKASKRMESV